MKNIKSFYFLIMSILFLYIACTDSVDPLQFDEMTVHYYKTGGWINYFQIKIANDGLTEFHELAHASLDTLTADSIYLSESEKARLSNIFSTFDTFKRNYQPVHFWTDQNYYMVILEYANQPDTVSVYDPIHCDLPGDLIKIINFFEAKITEMKN